MDHIDTEKDSSSNTALSFPVFPLDPSKPAPDTFQEFLGALTNYFPWHTRKIPTISDPLLDNVCNCLNFCVRHYTPSWEPIVETIAELLRVLRLCAVDNKAATYLVRDGSGLFDFVNYVVPKLGHANLESALFVKILLQVLLNIISGGSEISKIHKRQVLRSQLDMRIFMNLCDYFSEASALYYNAYYDTEVTCNYLRMNILRIYSKNAANNEYLDLLMEKILTEPHIWNDFQNLPVDIRLQTLSFLNETLLTTLKAKLIVKTPNLPPNCLQVLSKSLSQSGSIVFQTSPQDSNSIKEVSMVLEILAQLSSKESYLQLLSNDRDLLINSGVLLINAHRLGKSEGSVFAPVEKLAQLQNSSKDVTKNPAFGFKGDLIRLIGNLCWKNRAMQNLAREAELIPVLLDCCKIDGKNPFITQWSILAIRNICENNRENQSIIGGLTFINTETSEEFGITPQENRKQSCLISD